MYRIWETSNDITDVNPENIQKVIIKNYNVIINKNYFYHEWIDSDIRWYQEKRKLPTGQNKHDDFWNMNTSYIIIE